MKKLIIRILVFCIPLVVFILLGPLLPTTPRASKSLLMSCIKKDSLLKHSPSPRIIFIGGSNTSFGLNSQMIKDSFDVNPINMGIHASLGIKYMIDNYLENIKNEDIVVLIPEYHHFFRDINFGSKELMRIVFDVNHVKLKTLNCQQFFKILPYIPGYSLTKLKPKEYLETGKNVAYSVDSFNEYGDVNAHWSLESLDVTPFKSINGKFNYAVIKKIQELDVATRSKGGILLVSFPCYQEASFNNMVDQILEVEEELIKSNLNVIGTSGKYKMPDSLMFDSPYHLNKKGVDHRTQLLIEDIAKAIPSLRNTPRIN